MAKTKAVKKFTMSLEKFGITRKHIQGSLKYNAIITLIGIAVISALGLGLGFKQIHLDTSWLAFYIIISVPVQEFVFRGAVQTYLYRIGNTPAVIAATVLYASIHYYDPLLTFLTLLAGLAWGYAFLKKPNLLGPVISHAILGIYLLVFVL